MVSDLKTKIYVQNWEFFKLSFYIPDSIAMTFFLLSFANRAYIAKYVEFQFNTSPSAASLFSGSSTMLGAITALVISIVVISWFKPSARALALFNVFADVCYMIIGFSFIAVSCDHSGINRGCETDCQCSSQFKPVCDTQAQQTYFSACSAGCTGSNGTVLMDCSCSESPTLSPGYCHTDCNTPLMAFWSHSLC